MGGLVAQGAMAPAGNVTMRVIRGGQPVDLTELTDPTIRPIATVYPEVITDARKLDLSAVREFGLPHRRLTPEVAEYRIRNQRHLWRGLRRAAMARALGIPTYFGALWGSVIHADGRVDELGLLSLRVVTTAGVNFIVDAFQNTTELENLKYHGLGTGTNAEASSDTALQTELTTQLNPDNTRATGSTTEGASANIYRTVGSNTLDASATVAEHGILSQAATGGGTLLDRSVFTGLPLISTDVFQTTYDLTVTAGG